MRATISSTILVICLICSYNIKYQVFARSSGAPISACNTLTPSHGGNVAQTQQSPYSIYMSESSVSQGQSIYLEILPIEETFAGFMLQARSVNEPNNIIGHFATPLDNYQLIDCANAINNTATHSSSNRKSNLRFEWIAPVDYYGEIVFKATIVESFANFWVGIESQSLLIVQDTELTTTPAAPTTEPTEDLFYDGCGKTKTCFGSPDGCVASRSCRAITSVTNRTSATRIGNIFEFELRSGFGSPSYVAVGLSTDNRMGDDSVIECVSDGTTVTAHSSWTIRTPQPTVSREQIPQDFIQLIVGSIVDGVIYCKVERDEYSTIMGNTFDLNNNPYHLLIATGSSVNSDSVAYHDILELASDNSIYLWEISEVLGRSNVLIRLHAAFMILAWVGTTSIGILFARYFRQTWVRSQACGKDHWFVWHRSMLSVTWILTMAGFIIIFVEVGGWSVEDNPHAILGTITTGLCFIQPIGAIFRPAPQAKYRPIFNWFHWTIGNSAHILGIATIFYAVYLRRADVPSWYTWILVAFVIFYCIMHITFSITQCLSDRTYSIEKKSEILDGNNNKMDAPLSRLRKTLLGLSIGFVILFVVTLVVVAVLGIEEPFEVWN